MAGVFLPGAFNQVAGGGDWQRPVRIVAGWLAPVLGLGNQTNIGRQASRVGRTAPSVTGGRLGWFVADGGDGLEQAWPDFGPADEH